MQPKDSVFRSRNSSLPDLESVEPYAGFLGLCRSPHTRYNYRQDLRVLHRFLVDAGVPSPLKAGPETLLLFAASLSRPGTTPTGKSRGPYSTRSLRRLLASTRSFYRYLAAAQKISSDPTAVFHNLKVRPPQRNPRPLRPSERRALLGALRAGTLEEVRTSLVVRLGLEAGLRVSEISGLRVRDVDLERSSVTVVGKGDKERTVPLTDALKALLRTYFNLSRETRGTSPLVFPSRRSLERPRNPKDLERDVKRAARWAGLERASKLTVHVLRHTFGTCLAEAGASAYDIRDLMGHSSITVSESYVKLASTSAREAHRKAFGGGGRALALHLDPTNPLKDLLFRWRQRKK